MPRPRTLSGWLDPAGSRSFRTETVSIAANSLVSWMTSSSVPAHAGSVASNRDQYLPSRDSLSAIEYFCAISRRLLAAEPSSRFAPMDAVARSNWRAMYAWPEPAVTSFGKSLNTRAASLNARALRSCRRFVMPSPTATRVPTGNVVLWAGFLGTRRSNVAESAISRSGRLALSAIRPSLPPYLQPTFDL